MIAKLTEENFGLRVDEVTLLDRHFGTEIYCISAREGRFILKILHDRAGDCETEGAVTEHLFRKGLRVARLRKDRFGRFTAEASGVRFTLQEYIDGTTLPVNGASDRIMERSAEFLGKTVLALGDFPGLPVRFGRDFFTAERALAKRKEWLSGLFRAEQEGDLLAVPLWEEQTAWLGKISGFDIDTKRLTYAASHGDYHIGQVIVKDGELAVVDWSSACRLPVCLEVATSFVFASPSCAGGEIDPRELAKYIRCFERYFPLAEYDIRAMPYVLFFWHTVCNYHPDEYASLPESYRPTAVLIRRLLSWLSCHADWLSEALADVCPHAAPDGK